MNYILKLYVDVFDKRALYDAARRHPDSKFCRGSLGTRRSPNVEACIQMLLDPGSVPDAGISIDSGECEHVRAEG